MSCLLRVCRICHEPGTVVIKHMKQVSVCGPLCKMPDGTCTWEHWQVDGEPEYYCHKHGKGRKARRKALIGYRCTYCGLEYVQHEPPPPCECIGARREREALRRLV